MRKPGLSLAYAIASLAACHSSAPATSSTTPTTTGPTQTGTGDGSGSSSTGSAAPPAGPPTTAGACPGGGSLTLGPPTGYDLKGTPGDVALGDLNGDKNVDLVAGFVDGGGRGQLAVWFGAGDGTFASLATYPLLDGGQPTSIALADFDNDGDVDVVVAGGAGAPELFLNNSDGTFGAATALPLAAKTALAAKPGVVRVFDLDADGRQDIVEHAGGHVGVWSGAGHAQFTAAELPAIDGLDRGGGLAVADVDGDKGADIAIAGSAGGKATVVVMLQRRGGGYSAAKKYAAGGDLGDAAAVVVGDFDGNGKPDIAALYVGASGGTIAVLPGKGDGTFGAATTLAVPDARAPAGLVAADLDGDGKLDLVATGAHGAVVLRANGKSFAAPVTAPANDTHAVAAADLRGDGHAGFAATRTGGVTVWPAACK